jgi:glutamyl-tRNA synthetase
MTTHASPAESQVLVRFAPSPTGWLHVGNLRTALVNYLFAKHHGGQFMLRIDDTDRERSRDEYEAGIIEDLAWMGMTVDLHTKQSERFDRYDFAKEKLMADGRLYPCYETPEELDVKRKMQASRGLPPIYDRAALTLTAAKKEEYAREGRRPHWRFKMNHAPIVWDDLIRGPVTFDGAKISDPVLIREDGVALFTLSTSVDDGEMPITHILRGEDHVSNTAVQLQVMEALGHKLPRFGHMALLKMKEGKISKREGGGDIKSLRAEGIFPLVLASYLAKIGTSDAIELAAAMDELVQQFGIEKLGRAMANYDPEELARLNQKYLHHMPYAEAKTGLDAAIDEAFWLQIRGNLHALSEAKDWWQMLHQPITPRIDDAGFTAQAATLLPVGEWGEGSWDQFVNAVKEATGRKGKELFMPLRLALTGMEHGPDMKTVFALLGRARAEKRLRGEAA